MWATDYILWIFIGSAQGKNNNKEMAIRGIRT
jgi:hypothetical protein